MDYNELKEALMSAEPSEYFEKYKNDGELRAVLPELVPLIGSEQNKKYHLEDVWEHTMMCIDIAATVKGRSANPEAFMLGTLVHDIGKPEAQTVSIDAAGEVIIHTKKHPKIGVPIASRLMDRLAVKEDIAEYVRKFVLYHDFLNIVDKKITSEREAEELIKEVDGCGILDDIMLFHDEVDINGVIPGIASAKKRAMPIAHARVRKYLQMVREMQ